VPEAAPTQVSPVDAARRELVERARKVWVDALIDLSRRNNLLHFRHLKTGTLELACDAVEALGEFLDGADVPIRRLCASLDDAMLADRVTEIRRRAQVNREERGLETLYMAIGSATWSSDDGGRPADAPVLLIPVTIQVPGRDARKARLQRVGDLQVNSVLLHALEHLHGCEIQPDDVLKSDGDEREKLDFKRVYDQLSRAAADVSGFKVSDRAVLGNFSFQKLAMVQDLRTSLESLVSNDVIAAIAGDTNARTAIGPTTEGADPRELDRVPPDAEFLVLDADSSQMRTIASVLAGDHVLIQGPPGTGKSQTISNLIASLTAHGKSVLFVAEKRAALAAVFDRLERIGLGHIAVDVHGADVSRKAVMKGLRDRLSLLRAARPVDAMKVHTQFSDRRERLNVHDRELHQSRPPSGRSVYWMQARILRLPETARSHIRWRGPALDALTEANISSALDLLKEAGANSDLVFGTNPSPWTGAQIQSGELAQRLLDAATSLNGTHLPQLLASLKEVCDLAAITAPRTPGEIRTLLDVLDDAERLLALYRVELFDNEPEALAHELEPAARGIFMRTLAWLTSSAFRAARKTVLAHRAAGTAPTRTLLAEMRDAADLLRRWSAISSKPHPERIGDAHARLRSRWSEFDERVRLLSKHLQHGKLEESSLTELSAVVSALAGDTTTPYRIPRMIAVGNRLVDLGMKPVIDRILESRPPPETWADMVEYAWISSCLERAWADVPDLASFNGRGHDAFVQEFQSSDRARIQIAADRVTRAHAEKAVAVMDQFPDQNQLVRREAAKETRHLSLRKLFAEAPDVLTALCPCWTASPLSVSQIFGSGQQYFDVVIFDEASQVLPHDAVPAIMRARQVVVAGDHHQLPPTAFFSDGGSEDDTDEDDDPSDTVGFESLLDLVSATSALHSDLQWHYRSRDESLIAFSNHHIYDDRLVTFPSVGGPPALSHVLVAQRPSVDVEEESSSAEVKRIVELVLEHARTRPSESLGVIALGIKHTIRVESAVDAALMSQPDASAFFDSQNGERFFVKNLERVQGDERDAIILTVGYGKDRAGNLLNRLGPINNQGGERRLNVAVTRARKRMTVVSSFTHQDMDPRRFHSPGANLLRLYIQYAASSGRILGDQGENSIPLNDFERDVADELNAHGIDLVPQYGASRYRIDLVAKHPRKPGRFVLAIECDGAAYHSAPTARDRDRLRQQHLEALGWRFHRIWSTDWFQRRAEEIDRALRAFAESVESADRDDANRAGAPDHQPSLAETKESPPRTQIEAPPPLRRLPKPRLIPGSPITEYATGDLVSLVRWIRSDGILRTHEELIVEMLNELGFKRRGHRIDEAFRAAIEHA
jgi:very-short-patch-repair endonuclease/DNA polymerase III delta prime subunit